MIGIGRMKHWNRLSLNHSFSRLPQAKVICQIAKISHQVNYPPWQNWLQGVKQNSLRLFQTIQVKNQNSISHCSQFKRNHQYPKPQWVRIMQPVQNQNWKLPWSLRYVYNPPFITSIMPQLLLLKATHEVPKIMKMQLLPGGKTTTK
jgi:hypothetical protein